MMQDVISNVAARPIEFNNVPVQQVNVTDKQGSKAFDNFEKQPRAYSEKILDEAAKNVNEALSGSNTRVEFSVYKPTHEVMVKIKDNKTGEVIREIPSKKDLEMAAYMRKLAGIIVDTKV